MIETIILEGTFILILITVLVYIKWLNNLKPIKNISYDVLNIGQKIYYCADEEIITYTIHGMLIKKSRLYLFWDYVSLRPHYTLNPTIEMSHDKDKVKDFYIHDDCTVWEKLNKNDYFETFEEADNRRGEIIRDKAQKLINRI